MNSKNKCIAICLADFLFNLFLNYYDRRYKRTGRHVLCVGLWKSILESVYEWENTNSGAFIHKGTPLYYLAETYLLLGNIDTASIYLFKAIEQDLDAGLACPAICYPCKSPSYLIASLKADKNNSMYYSVVMPARKEIINSLKRYRLRSNKSAILKMNEIDRKFLNPNKPKIANLDIINKIFVLELLKLNRTISATPIDEKVESNFSRVLLLNRLFGFSFVIDMLLYELYSSYLPSSTMGVNVENFVIQNKINMLAYKHFLNGPCKSGINFNKESVDNVLTLLLTKQHQVTRGFNLPEEIIPILIAYKIRNTSAHKLQSNFIVFQKFGDIIQKLYEALFVLISKLP